MSKVNQQATVNNSVDTSMQTVETCINTFVTDNPDIDPTSQQYVDFVTIVKLKKRLAQLIADYFTNYKYDLTNII